ncbi:TPA: fimbria/pilus periplasmic chaperone [Escherichia coli]
MKLQFDHNMMKVKGFISSSHKYIVCFMLFMSAMHSVKSVNANETIKAAERELKEFSLDLGMSRIVYNPDAKGATLPVLNRHGYPILVQSEVLSENYDKSHNFVVTPPLFRLDPHQSNRIRIIRVGGEFPEDRESLKWVCVKGIPPKHGDKWVETQKNNIDKNISTLQIQVSITNCVKLFVRPNSIKGRPDSMAQLITWQRKGNKLQGTNPTPFYMNISDLIFGDKRLDKTDYIAPFSTSEYEVPAGTSGKVKWRVITDYGGKSKLFEYDI